MNNFNKCCSNRNYNNFNEERFLGGGFLVPFLAGAVVSAPFWYLGASNKAQQQNYYPQPYPVYYPYSIPTNESYPTYYPYPQFR